MWHRSAPSAGGLAASTRVNSRTSLGSRFVSLAGSPQSAPAIRARGYGGETQALVLSGWPSHVLVLRNAVRDSHGWPRLEYLLAEAAPPSSTMFLRFDDTCDASDSRAPRDEHVEQLVSFARSLSVEDRLLVLCAGGFGRSTAAAIVLRVACGNTPAQALAETVADRPQATPNRLLLARGDAVLGLQGELWRVYADWAWAALGLRYDPPVPLRPGRRRRRGWGRTST